MPSATLFILPGFSFGGAERVAADILGNLKASGGRTLVAAVRRQRGADGGNDSAGPWFSEHSEVLRLSASSLPDSLLQLIELQQIDTLVLCGRSAAYSCLPRIKALHPQLRIVGFIFNARQLIWEHRRFVPYLDAIIAESADAAAALNAGGEGRLPVTIVSSGIDVRGIADRPIDRSGRTQLTIGYVGRFDRSKNPKGFLAMARHLRADGLSFVMAGPAPASFRAPAGVTHAGVLVGEDKERFLDQIDILVVPSRNDGRPLVIHEAQGRGIVVVATRVGAIPELIEDGVSGLLCPPGDPKLLADAVRRLTRDPVLREMLGRNGRERALAQGDIGRSMPRYIAAITGGYVAPRTAVQG